MKKLIAVFAMLFTIAAPACAAFQATDSEGTTVTVTMEPCTSDGAQTQLPKLNAALGGQRTITAAGLRAATVIYRGKPYGACWMPMGDAVVVLDDGGQENSLFVAPAAAFREVEGT